MNGTWKAWLLGGLAVLGSSCGGGGGDDAPPPPPPPPDLSGVWAGTWEGFDSVFGRVTGSWEVEASQDESGVVGKAFLSGDVDCAEGDLSGTVPSGAAPGGTLDRSPCPSNQWTLTALDLATRSASGTWTKPETGGAGSFTGTQVATPGGPRIAFFHPPGGRPGAIVTVVGSGFAGATPGDILFDDAPAEAFLSSLGDRVVTTVPAGATTGRLFVSTLPGTAISPRDFRVEVSHPVPVSGTDIFVGASQEGVAASPDGRRLYIAAGDTGVGSPSVVMVDTASLQRITATPLTAPILQGIAVSPDGRRLYTGMGPGGVAVLHGVSAALLEVLPIPAGDGSRANPQGIAVSPDGTLLYVADCRDGGAVTVWDLPGRRAVATIPTDPGVFPTGVAPAPAGDRAYVALASDSGPGEIAVYDVGARALSGRLAAGNRPLGVTVTPDGAKLVVAHASDNSIVLFDTASGNPTAAVAVGTLPSGVAVSPDGRFAYAANRGGQTVTVVDLETAGVAATVPVLSGPVAVALSPDGLRAYVAHQDFGLASQIGEAPVLTIAKGGTGIGTVTSSPAGIDCGATCSAGFEPDTAVTLTASPYGGSTFSGWGGDPDCTDGVVTVAASRTCVATFTATTTGGGGGGSGGGGCFVAACSR